MVLVVVAICASAARLQAAGRPEFRAYGVLADERLMYPIDLRDWPVKIDGSRQLFVDDYLIASMENIQREVHQPTRHADNPLLMTQREDKAFSVHMPFVVRDQGKFRMWYSAEESVYTMPSGVEARWCPLYAESEDGIHWKTPELGLYEWKGSKANNIILPAGPLVGIFIEPDDPDPNRRYKAIVWHEPKYVPREGCFLYASPDGIHWKRARQEPLLQYTGARGYRLPASCIGDTTIFRWDEQLGKYAADVKIVLPPRMRCFGIMESDDLIHWTRPRMTLYPDGKDEPDTQIYGHRGFCYESMWIGFARILHTKRKGWKQTPVELTASRDGRHWTRVGRGQEFLATTGEYDWDADYQSPTSAPILVGDKLWIYYQSCIHPEHDREKGDRHGLGLAILRRDGFVSLNGGEKTGILTTRPLSFNGKKLYVNVDVKEGGSLKVALLGRDGKPIESYSLNEAVPIETGGLAVPVKWKTESKSELSADKHVRLQFELTNAKLYSFWIEQSEVH